MTSSDSSTFRPGRIFVLLWAFTVFTELISLQIRLAIFGGTGWLTFIKFTSFSEELGFILVAAILCAALCGIWTGLCALACKLAKNSIDKIVRWCATLWIVIVVVELIFRHGISEYLGDAFDFFEFATGVGGVWRMLVQAFQWYGDVILLSLLGIAAFTVAVFFFFRWVFKPRKKASKLDKIPAWIIASTTAISFVFGILLMSIWGQSFPKTRHVMAEESMMGAIFNGIVHVCTDVDGDGYGAFDLPPDTMPFDGDLHPYALDTPDDHTNQNLLLDDLQTDLIPPAIKKRTENMGMAENQSHTDRRHVVVVLMESVRWDMLDAKVDGKPVMPELQKLIQRGAIRHDQAFATRGFTQNSVTQTFWGSYFEPGHSLVDDFKNLGYHTAAFSGESMLDEKFDESCGWNRNGDTLVDPRFIEANIYQHESVPARVLMDEAEKFLADYDTNQPLFMYVFYQDPHFPYQQYNPSVFIDREIKRTEIAVKTRPRLWRSYANQVHHLDMAAGRLIKALENKQMLDDTLLIFISDHGESLFDDGYLLGHGIAIQDLMTHCVMVVWGAHHDIPSPMSHVDIRRFIHEDLASENSNPKLRDSSLPVLQFIGSTNVPSAISYRYGDGSRVAYEFATNTAWRETSNASFVGQTPRMTLPDHGNTPIDTKVNISRSLMPAGTMISPIPKPLENPQIQTLIHDWEYLQWYHRHD